MDPLRRVLRPRPAGQRRWTRLTRTGLAAGRATGSTCLTSGSNPSSEPLDRCEANPPGARDVTIRPSGRSKQRPLDPRSAGSRTWPQRPIQGPKTGAWPHQRFLVLSDSWAVLRKPSPYLKTDESANQVRDFYDLDHIGLVVVVGHRRRRISQHTPRAAPTGGRRGPDRLGRRQPMMAENPAIRREQQQAVGAARHAHEYSRTAGDRAPDAGLAHMTAEQCVGSRPPAGDRGRPARRRRRRSESRRRAGWILAHASSLAHNSLGAPGARHTPFWSGRVRTVPGCVLPAWGWYL